MAGERNDDMGRTPGVSPYLTVEGGKDAITFYEAAFGAAALFVKEAQDGHRVMHATLSINGGVLMLSDNFVEFAGEMKPPASVILHLQVDDADTWWDRALAAGCSVKFALENQFWGDRYGQLKDPFGHVWSIAGPLTG